MARRGADGHANGGDTAGQTGQTPGAARRTTPTGRQAAVELIATDPQDLHLAGSLLRHLSPAQLAGQQALALPAPIAQDIDARSLQPIKLQVGAHAVPTPPSTSAMKPRIAKDRWD